MTDNIQDRYLTDLVKRMVENHASDLHIQEGKVPYFRLIGKLSPLSDEKPVDRKTLEKIIESVLTPPAMERFEKSGAADVGVKMGEVRIRLNAFKHLEGLALSIRLIPGTPPVFHDLNLPPVVKRFANLQRGLVIVCGPTGCGKSTTIAAIINHINSTARMHIITIEDPIEFVHLPKTGLVVQREVGMHADSFASALRDSLREDPDVIVVGEMRDLETIELALRAAETGHLVFSTLHTSGATGSLSRIVDAFEPGSRATVRVQLSLTLVGVISQLLLTTRDGKSRVPACEVLVVNDAVRHIIREGKFQQISNIIQSGGSEGMLSFSSHITELSSKGLIDTASGLDAVGEAWRIAEMIFET
ncbi:MAG: PilT/PilU family type 4a pilus ATPase [bacterium]